MGQGNEDQLRFITNINFYAAKTTQGYTIFNIVNIF